MPSGAIGTSVLLLTIMLTNIPHFYKPDVFSHPSIYNGSVLYLGKPIISRHQSYVSGGITKLVQVGTCYAWDIITFIIVCNLNYGGGTIVITAISSTAYR